MVAARAAEIKLGRRGLLACAAPHS
jgi:hypothetical protein